MQIPRSSSTYWRRTFQHRSFPHKAKEPISYEGHPLHPVPQLLPCSSQSFALLAYLTIKPRKTKHNNFRHGEKHNKKQRSNKCKNGNFRGCVAQSPHLVPLGQVRKTLLETPLNLTMLGNRPFSSNGCSPLMKFRGLTLTNNGNS